MMKLPVGVTEFNALIDSLINHPEVPTKDRDSVVFAVAAMIMHGKEDLEEVEDDFFLKRLRAGAAKQVAHGLFMETKERQQAAAKAQQEAEATANESQGQEISGAASEVVQKA